MQTNPAIEQSKIVRWSESPCNQSGTVELFSYVVTLGVAPPMRSDMDQLQL